MDLGSIFRIHEIVSWDTHPAPTTAAAFAESVELWPRAIVAVLTGGLS